MRGRMGQGIPAAPSAVMRDRVGQGIPASPSPVNIQEKQSVFPHYLRSVNPVQGSQSILLMTRDLTGDALVLKSIIQKKAIHAVRSIRVLNIRASTQIWEENKGNLRVFPVLRLISQEYSQYSISDTKGNVIIHVEVHLSGFIEHQTWAFKTANGCIVSQKW